MRVAVGTSLLVIALKSAAGFVGYHGQLVDAGVPIAWKTIAIFIVLGGIGTVIGGAIGGRLPQRRLRQVFAVFLVVMGVAMLVKEASGLRADEGIATSGSGSSTAEPARSEASDPSRDLP